MSTDAIAVLGFVVLFILMLLRVPVGMAMGLYDPAFATLIGLGAEPKFSRVHVLRRAPSVTPELCGDPSRLGSSKNGYLVLNPAPGPGSCHQASIPAQKSG